MIILDLENINNIENALSITNAPVIDVSSGVEKKKGIKCEKKIKNCLNSIDKQVKVLVIENSNNSNFKET